MACWANTRRRGKRRKDIVFSPSHRYRRGILLTAGSYKAQRNAAELAYDYYPTADCAAADKRAAPKPTHHGQYSQKSNRGNCGGKPSSLKRVLEQRANNREGRLRTPGRR